MDLPSLAKSRALGDMFEMYEYFYSYDTVSYHKWEAKLPVEMKYSKKQCKRFLKKLLLLLHSKGLKLIGENCCAYHVTSREAQI